MSLTLLVNYCVCKNGRKPPSALTGDISSQILILFIKGQICIANLWRDDQQDFFFFSKGVAPSVFYFNWEGYFTALDKVRASCGSACLQPQHPTGRSRVALLSLCSFPSSLAAPGQGKKAPSTHYPSCLHCHLLLRGRWRPSTNCSPWP